MVEYISRKAAIAYIREQSEECQKAFEELGGESGIYADAYNDLADDFCSIPAADVAPVVHCKDCKHSYITVDARCCSYGTFYDVAVPDDFFCALAERKDGDDNAAD